MKGYSFELIICYPESMEGFPINSIYLNWKPSQKEESILFWHLLESFKNPFPMFEISEFTLEKGEIVFYFKGSSPFTSQKKVVLFYDCFGPITLKKPILGEMPLMEKLLTSQSRFIRENVKKLLPRGD